MIDITGLRFYSLVVKGKSGEKNKEGRAKWKCVCDCGAETLAYANQLKGGNKKSCGCLPVTHNVTHGRRNHPLYNTWRAMVDRCNNPDNSNYSLYGGRGIKVCKEWLDIDAFINDMHPKPSRKHSIDRKDNEGDYCPENCRWATSREQGRNKRNTILLTLDGVTMSLPEWAEHKGVKRRTMYMRYRRGCTTEEIINGKHA